VPSSSLKKKENEYYIYVIHKEEPKMESELAKGMDKKKDKTKGLFGILNGKKKEESKLEANVPKEKPAEYGAIEVRKVGIGYMSEDLVEINKGVAEDEIIVVEVQEDFKDKARVEIAEMQEGVL
jgi:hypothetical protein